MPRMCCVNNCANNKSPKSGDRKISFFKLPRNPMIKEKWLKASEGKRRVDRPLKLIYFCENHFEAADIKRTFHILLPNNRVDEYQCNANTLKKNAVPSIYDSLNITSDGIPDIDFCCLPSVSSLQNCSSENDAENQSGCHPLNTEDTEVVTETPPDTPIPAALVSVKMEVVSESESDDDDDDRWESKVDDDKGEDHAPILAPAFVAVKEEKFSEAESDGNEELIKEELENPENGTDYLTSNANFNEEECHLRLESGSKKGVREIKTPGENVSPSDKDLGVSLGPFSKCFHCKKVFPLPATLAVHLMTCTPKGADKKFKCEICGTGLSSAATLRRHKLSHSGERPYKCNLCAAAFMRQAHLNDHKRKHTGEKAHVCSTCGSAFSQLSNLRTHEKQHRGLREKKVFHCEVCGADFGYSSSLRTHLLNHTGERPYECEICHARFKHQQSLVVHGRRHTGERPYQCDTCGARFSQYQGLNVHRRTHSGEKPFACRECGAAFTQLHSLRAHERRHAGLRPFACDACDASFVTRDKMRYHIRIHTGERPYVCPTCGKAFTTASDLNRHRRIHWNPKEGSDKYSKNKVEDKCEVPTKKPKGDSSEESGHTKEISHQNDMTVNEREYSDVGNNLIQSTHLPALSVKEEEKTRTSDADVEDLLGIKDESFADRSSNELDCNKSALDLSLH